MDRDEFYTAAQAAKVLGKSERWVRQLASDGQLEGERTADGWKLFRRSVHDFRDSQRDVRGSREATEWPVEAREALQKVNVLERELGRLEGRLELTAVAESTLREQLERERQRADEERESLERERQRADAERERAERLEQELAESRRPWWQRWFGT